jgi:sulfatase maturation enzyme AslB (radical SAM superfamily)
MNFKGKKVIEIKNNSEYSIVDWILGNYCNYKCSYCFPNCNTGTDRPPKINETVKNNIKHLVNQIQKFSKKKIYFNLAGGEPTVYHDIDNLLTFLNSVGAVGIITNGSRSVRWWDEFGDKFDKVTISYHTEEGNVDHIVEVANLIKNRTQTQIHVVLNDQRFDQAEEAYHKFYSVFKNTNVIVENKFLRSTNGKIISYTQEQLDRIQKIKNQSTFLQVKSKTFDCSVKLETGEKMGLSPVSFKDFDGTFLDYNCKAHYNFLQIDQKGELGKLSCFEEFHKIVNIFDEQFTKEFNLISDTLICSKTGICNCLGLLYSDKTIT